MFKPTHVPCIMMYIPPCFSFPLLKTSNVLSDATSMYTNSVFVVVEYIRVLFLLTHTTMKMAPKTADQVSLDIYNA